MAEPSDDTFARGETLHSACLCCEHAAKTIEGLRDELGIANSLIDTCEMWIRNLKAALKPFAVELKGFDQTTFYLCKDPQGQASLMTIDADDFQRAVVLHKKGIAEEIEDRTNNPFK